MSYKIKIAQRQEFESKELWEMYKLRAKVFKGRMGWDIPLIGDMEVDGYDALDPFYMIIQDKDNHLKGCWRILPTEGPYMLKDTFPELLDGSIAPTNPRVWELSRFAIETDSSQGFGFSDLTIDAMKAIVKFGDQMGIDAYVTVTTTAIERMMQRERFGISRIGPPLKIGVEKAVAIIFDIGEKTHRALFGDIQQAA